MNPLTWQNPGPLGSAAWLVQELFVAQDIIKIKIYSVAELRNNMVQANNTIFQFYLAMMDSFREYLSDKYPISSSIEDTKHYQTVIITKIVQMFHSIELITKNSLDEVSARCVLRGILDSVTAYSFIYQKTDFNEMLFRHYLYALDGWREYKKSVISTSEENEYKDKEDCACDYVIKQIEEKLKKHIYYAHDRATANLLIQNSNWKYESLQNPRSLKFGEMYAAVGFNNVSIEYFQGYLSQFVHGLCLSNKPTTDSEQMKRVLYECIPIADKFIQAMNQSFRDKGMTDYFLRSNVIKKFMDSQSFSFNELAESAFALVRKDKTLLI